MTNLLRPLAATVVAVGVATLGALAIAPDDPPKSAAAKPADKPSVAGTEVGHGVTAVDPKPLSEAVKKGLKWLVNQQNDDGGWSQGGGWRTGAQNGERQDGKDVKDPSDVGNTCVAVLALVRAGNTTSEGDYKDNVRKGLKYLCEQIDKSNDKDLYITDVRNTQIQSKIGPFADTFLGALVLAELKGKAGDDEKKLAAALDKTLGKMAKNQQADGTFAGNGGWAPVLSQGVANKALSRAKLNGATVDDQVFARATKQTRAALNGTGASGGGGFAATAKVTSEETKAPTVLGFAIPMGKLATGRSSRATILSSYAAADGFAGGGIGDAGVPLYSRGQALGNTQDVLNGIKFDADAAKKIIADPKATAADKKAAELKVKEAEELTKDAVKAQTEVAGRIRDRAFVGGFGSNGGEEFLSFLNISEMLVIKANKEWKDWDGQMQEGLNKAQDKDGSWAGHHCITGKTFCTSTALLVLLADRTQFPVDVIKAAREVKKDEKK